MPEISVIVPVYKVEQFLDRCIDSIKKQSFVDFECILVDDGSPDNCGTICDKVAREDKRFKVIHKENGGLSSARNAALEIVEGNYISFVDSDDLLHPQMLEILLKQMKDTDSDIVSTGLNLFYEELPEERSMENLLFDILEQKDFIEHLYPYNFGRISVTACGKIYKREIFGKLRYPEGKIYEDLWVYLEVLLSCKRISVANTSLYYYYQNPASITKSNYLAHDRFGEFVVRYNYIEFFRKRGLQEQGDYAENDYLTFFMRNFFAVKLKYKDKENELVPYIRILKKQIKSILKNSKICRMRKICTVIMLISPSMAYLVCKKTIPDCLILEMQ